MNRQIIGPLVVFISVVIIIGIGIFLYNSNKSNNNQAAAPTEKGVITNKATSTQAAGSPAVKEEKKTIVTLKSREQNIIVPKTSEQMEIERMAGFFTERYGTYSNQANFANLSDSLIYMSDAMKDRTLIELEGNKKQNINTAIYSGLTTRVVAKKMVNYKDGDTTAKVIASAIRTENLASGEVGLSNNRDMEVNLVKVNGVWKVDSATWQ
ncbi:MAG: hypothetical protein NT091_00985 [Candidatus Falkowbacteria bacterium]|nr:hypothetical protein [Candidatus Falkowbacteria bacterium]